MKTSGFLEKDGSKVGKPPQFVTINTSNRRPGALQRNKDSFWLGKTRYHTDQKKQPWATSVPSLDRERQSKGWGSQEAIATLTPPATFEGVLQVRYCPYMVTFSPHKLKTKHKKAEILGKNSDKHL